MRERSALFERIDIVQWIIITPPARRRGGCASVCGSIIGIRIASIIINNGIGIGKAIPGGSGSRGPNRSGGSNGRAIRIEASRIAGCIASTSGTSTTAKVLARALHGCSVRASWMGGGSAAIQIYVY